MYTTDWQTALTEEGFILHQLGFGHDAYIDNTDHTGNRISTFSVYNILQGITIYANTTEEVEATLKEFKIDPQTGWW